MQDRILGRWLTALLLVAVICPRTGAQNAGDAFAECEERMRADPGAAASALCFFLKLRSPGAAEELWAEAANRLQGYLDTYPDSPWLHLSLGHVLFTSRPQCSEDLYRGALRLFDEQDDLVNGVKARLALVRRLSRDDRFEDGNEVLAKAAEMADKVGDRLLLADVRIRQAYQNLDQGKRLGYSYYLLKQIERDVFDADDIRLKRRWLEALGIVCHYLGRHDEARRSAERWLEIALQSEDVTSQAQARFAIATYLTASLPGPEVRREARDMFEEALASAKSAAPTIAARSHLALGMLMRGVNGRSHLETCRDMANGFGITGLLRKCQIAMAASVLKDDPRKARALIDEVLAAAASSPDPWESIFGWEDRLPVHWATLPRSEAVKRSLSVIGRIEELRELQTLGSGRAGLISLWAEVYYWLSGHLLESAESRQDVELAFQVTERMRSRVILEALESARATSPPPEAAPLLEDLAEVIQRKVPIHRRLINPQLDQHERDEIVAELSALESEEAGLRSRIAEASPSYAALNKPAPSPLSEIEQSLGHDEALLSFQFGLDEDFFGRFAGGSWLLVSTRDGTRTYRVKDRVALEPGLKVLLDMDEPAVAGLARLYHELLAPALDDLPPTIQRLVIVPDGELHRLPFALLRPAEDAQPLIARYELSLAPSATLWHRWRSLDRPTSDLPVLALADPVLADQDDLSAGEPGASERQWAFRRSARLRPLPYAREEGRAVVRALGGKGTLLVGEEATERFLKENDLRRYGVLHFAAHAVIDDEIPEQSAVLLAPGADDEDGWLQPEDIVSLDLDGRVVVLASCDSAVGQVLRGEGPMSLARAFFQAGAPVVVASLWPLPDDATARLSKELYRGLARGMSVAEALAVAQRKRLRHGAPSRSWAGLVVLGNGDLVPFPGGLESAGLRSSISGGSGLLALVVVLIVFLSLFVARRARRA